MKISKDNLIMKMVFAGDYGVGKSSLFKRIKQNLTQDRKII